jgi:hypothetical protein
MRDDQGRLHNTAGAAIQYPDGWGIWAVGGVRVNKEIIENPETITVDKIEGERNTEVRRIMIDLYGQSRYLIDSKARVLNADDYGTLYIKQVPDDEPIVMVKLINSTPEPDGTFKDYFLRVPPTMKTAREAVAWTFGKSQSQYAPLVET